MAAGTVVRFLPYSDPLALFAVFADDAFALLLDSAADTGGRGRYSYICAEPAEILILKDDPAALTRLRRRLETGPHHPAMPDLPPFQGGAAGYFAYDLGRGLEHLPRLAADDMGFPDLAVGLFPAVVAFDHHREQAWIIGEEAAAQILLRRLRAARPLPEIDWRPAAAAAPDLAAENYQDRLRRVIDYIHAGDIFQANLSQRFSAHLPPALTPFLLYRRLRALSPAPFAAYLACGDVRLASASPERFLKLDADGRVETRPIKGTRPRSPEPFEDAALRAELLASAKDRAENLMIVDLLRNDLSRVCDLGSVRVPELFTLESFASVHHLVSMVEGRLRPGLGAVDLLQACFPGGSITGAPKIRAMEIIEELEPVRRGPYCGAIGWIGWDGAMDSNIVIRTICIHKDRAVVQAGGGIVADSEPLAEYAETLVKADALLASLRGAHP